MTGTATALLIDDRESLLSLYSLNLGLYVGTNVLCKKNHQEVVEYLKTNPKINLIISKSNISQQETAFSIYQYLNEQKLSIPLIVLGKEPKITQNAKELDSVPEMKELVKTAAQFLGVTAQKMALQEVPEHFPIPTNLFKNDGPLVCDVYKKQSESYVKAYEQGKKIPQGDVDTLEKTGEFFLYVPSKVRLKFAQSVTEKILASLRNENLTTAERIQVTDEGLKMISEEMRNCGILENTIMLAEESIKSIVHVAEKSPTLTELIRGLMADQVSFRFKHCQVLTYVCFHILQNMDWGTKEQQDKMAFVAFFHDIALNSDEETDVHSEADLNESKLSGHQKEVVRKHAALAANLVKDLPNLPLGAEIIIKQHHGSRTGVGLGVLSAAISPLSQVFVVAEEWTHIALKSHQEGRKISNAKLLKYLREKTGNTQNYAKIIDTLEKIKI